MTTTHVALLRGINVGKAKRIAMADLRALVEGLGYGDARTLLNSGNVVFTAPARTTPAAAARRIEDALEGATGVRARVLALSAAELAEAAAQNSLGAVATDDSRLLVSFVADPGLIDGLRPLLARDWGDERLALGKRAAYAWCPRGALDSPLSVAIAKVLRDAATARNWATVKKLVVLAGE